MMMDSERFTSSDNVENVSSMKTLNIKTCKDGSSSPIISGKLSSTACVALKAVDEHIDHSDSKDNSDEEDEMWTDVEEEDISSNKGSMPSLVEKSENSNSDSDDESSYLSSSDDDIDPVKLLSLLLCLDRMSPAAAFYAGMLHAALEETSDEEDEMSGSEGGTSSDEESIPSLI